MAASFQIAYKNFIQPGEGYYAFLPGDKGGQTYAGISRVNFPNWSGWKIVDEWIDKNMIHNGIISPAMSVKNNQVIPGLDELVEKFYLDLWNRNFMNQIMNQDVANIYFDFIVNSGSSRATKEIQKIVGVTVDGRLTSDTISAINKRKGFDLANLIKERRKQFYIELNQPNFLKGWLSRLSKFPTLTAPTAPTVTGIIIALIIVSLLLIRK